MPYLEGWQIFAPHWPRTTSAQIVTQEKARSASQKCHGKFSMVGEHRVAVSTGEGALNRGLVTGTQAHSKDLEQSRGQCKKNLEASGDSAGLEVSQQREKFRATKA